MRRGGTASLVAILTTILMATLLPATSVAAPSRGPDGNGRRAALPDGVERPDIVVLVLDDLPQLDDRLWERLPTIKRLFLDGGVRFTDVIGNDPLCCPGRANLLSGQWTMHHGVRTNHATLFDPRVSIATELQAAGYWTGIFGKYFNESHKLVDKHPHGWDRSFIFSGDYWTYRSWRNGRLVWQDGRRSSYSTSRIRVRAVAALEAAPARRPRFVWLAPFAPHFGTDANGVGDKLMPAPLPRDVGAPACADIAPWSTPATTQDDLDGKPAFLQDLPRADPLPLVRHCEALLSVDRMLASVLATFAAQGRTEPMVILTADNGMAWGAHHWLGKHVPYATPIPLFIRWTRLLGTAPATVPTTLTNVDLAPTLCAIAGCTMGPFPNGFDADGISFLPLLLDVGEVNRGARRGTTRQTADGVRRRAGGRIAGLSLGREVVFEEHWVAATASIPGFIGLRTTDESPIGRWVWTEYATGERELYDISGGPCWAWQAGDPGDPCQLTNLAGHPDHAETQAILEATLAARAGTPLRLRGLRR